MGLALSHIRRDMVSRGRRLGTTAHTKACTPGHGMFPAHNGSLLLVADDSAALTLSAVSYDEQGMGKREGVSEAFCSWYFRSILLRLSRQDCAISEWSQHHNERAKRLVLHVQCTNSGTTYVPLACSKELHILQIPPLWRLLPSYMQNSVPTQQRFHYGRPNVGLTASFPRPWPWNE